MGRGVCFAWVQGICTDAGSGGGADDLLIEALAESSKRSRTRLAEEEVGAVRAACVQGVSVNALARWFEVHWGTVWAKTR